jgi:hypothetical protein
VVDQKSALSKEFLDVTVRERKAQVPADRKQDHFRFKSPPLEKTRNRRRQQEHQLSISDCSCKVATLPFLQTEFGLESEYQARKGVHADFLGRVTVVLPNAWESRLVPIKDEDGLLKGYAAEIHDVAVSKLIARTLENAGLRQDAAIFRGWLRP